MVVLSRVLSPKETGLFTVAAAVTALISTLRDFGVSSYIIQERNLTQEKLQAALGVAYAFSVVMAGVVVAISGPAGGFYGDAGVTRILRVMALAYLFIPMNATVMMCLRREFRFPALYRISLAGSAAHAATAISLGLMGASYMCLAWATVANGIATMAAGYAVRPRQYRFVPSLRGWRAVLSFSVYTTAGSICAEAVTRGCDLVIGRVLGFTALGLFSRGGSVLTLVNQSLLLAISPVALSLFARTNREGGAVRQDFLRATAMVTGVACPAFAVIAVMAGPLIPFLFGPGWTGAVAPARLIAVSGIVGSMHYLHWSLYQSIGANKERLRVQLLIALPQVFVITGLSFVGLRAAAFGMIVNAAIELIVSQAMINRLLGISARAFLDPIGRSLFVTLAAAAGPAAVWAGLLSSHGLWRPLMLAGLLAAPGWLAAVAATRHPLWAELLATAEAIRPWLRTRPLSARF